jgi:hypothetical protein
MRVRRIPMTGTVGLVCALLVHDAGASACPPAAVVQGTPRIVTSVREILRAHGVAGDASSCPDQRVRASLKETGAGSYHLQIEDAFGRHSDREVNDAETAASLIESWAVPVVDEVPDAVPLPAVIERGPRPISSSLAPDSVRWRLSGSIEVAGGSDDSLWYGSALTGCATLAGFCLGGRLRLARDDSVLGPDRDISRSATEALLVAAWPLVRRNVTVTPILGIGAGWIHTGAPRPEADANTRSSNDLGARVEAAASAGLALSARVSLVGEIGASWGPSLVSVGRDDRAGAGATVAVPGAYVRAAIACQYAP